MTEIEPDAAPSGSRPDDPQPKLNTQRRAFLAEGLRGLLCLPFVVGTATLILTPEEAKSRQLPLRSLSVAQGDALESLAECIVPGASSQGVLHFIDQQLSVSADESLLVARYFDLALPYLDFYVHGLETLDHWVQEQGGHRFGDLAPQARQGLVRRMIDPTAVVNGFPIFIFYLCVRSDALDVTYGTPRGFEALNIPYLPHIAPPSDWAS